jgi:hypothetical protein
MCVVNWWMRLVHAASDRWDAWRARRAELREQDRLFKISVKKWEERSNNPDWPLELRDEVVQGPRHAKPRRAS